MAQAKFVSQQTMAFFYGVDTACGRKLDISSSLLSQSSGVCWVLFFFRVGRLLAFTLLGELQTYFALFRRE